MTMRSAGTAFSTASKSRDTWLGVPTPMVSPRLTS